MYNATITHKEIAYFRGAVIKALGDNPNLLYHNHIDDSSYRFAYPLIQYKRINGKAAITCIEGGVDVIGQFLSETSEPLMIGRRETKIEVEKVIPEKVKIQISDSSQTYSLHQWLPLNSKNYEQYKNAEGIVDKIQILERVLTGNILSFLKGVGIHLEEHLDIHITDITKQDIIKYKGVIMMSFDIKFKANITLPSYIGIGKNASMGYGILIPK
jgi:hypothetical protein